MKAMIFAAGKGTRLKPLTNNTPKALVKVNGTPMLELVIKKLIEAGVTEIIVNVHYLGNQIINFLKSKNNFGIRIEISDESEQLLDTGGGLLNASHFFNDNKPFIVHNTDVISNIDLKKTIDFHIKNNALATLAIRKRKSSRYFLFNQKMELCGWKNTKTSEEIISRKHDKLESFAFSGIHIISPDIFNLIEAHKKTFSIVDTYIELSKEKRILGYLHNQDTWFDIGKSENLQEAENYLIQNRFFI